MFEKEVSLEGLTQMVGATYGEYLYHLPLGLKSLTFGNRFNQSLQGVTLPGSLQTLSFGSDFDQSLEGVILPSSLKSLTFGHQFNQRLEGISLPSSLQNLAFGHDFEPTYDGMTLALPDGLQSLTLSGLFDGSPEDCDGVYKVPARTFEKLDLW